MRCEDDALLPHRSSLWICDVVDLIENDERIPPVTAIEFVSIYLCRRDDDVRVPFNLSIAGKQSYRVIGREDVLELTIFCVGEGFQRGGVDRVLPLLDEITHRLNRNVRLPRASWCNHKRVDAGGEVVDRLLLEIVNDELLFFWNAYSVKEALPRFLNGPVFQYWFLHLAK